MEDSSGVAGKDFYMGYWHMALFRANEKRFSEMKGRPGSVCFLVKSCGLLRVICWELCVGGGLD